MGGRVIEAVCRLLFPVHVQPALQAFGKRFSDGEMAGGVSNLIEVQVNSYKWFLKQGLKEVFSDISAITDYTGNLVLDFIDYRLDESPKYSVTECKVRDVTYDAPLHVRARLLNKETGEVNEQEIFMGNFPLMTESGTFIINGAERVIVSQLVRSPGVYYDGSFDKTGKKLEAGHCGPHHGTHPCTACCQ